MQEMYFLMHLENFEGTLYLVTPLLVWSKKSQSAFCQLRPKDISVLASFFLLNNFAK